MGFWIAFLGLPLGVGGLMWLLYEFDIAGRSPLVPVIVFFVVVYVIGSYLGRNTPKDSQRGPFG